MKGDLLAMATLNALVSDIEVKDNKVGSTESPNSSWTTSQYTDANTITAAFKNLLNKVHPPGSFYETTDANFDPNTAWGSRGESWELVSSSYERIYLNSQVMHPGVSGTGLVSKTNLCGAYYTELFDPLYSRFTKAGYHIEFKFTAMITTANDNPINFYLNDTNLGSFISWSGSDFRRLWKSNFIELDDIAKTPAAGYTTTGYTLAYAVTNLSTSWAFWDLTAHTFLVSDNPVYKWKRIS